jgi:hypothetical protein
LAAAGCGVSVDQGGRNAATHPASGIFVSNTVGGGGAISTKHAVPTVTYQPPNNKPPAAVPAGLAQTEKAVEAAITGGCWEDSHQGDVNGAYDQLFWWTGDCGDTVVQVTAEAFASAAKAKSEERHATSSPVLARYIDGALLVTVWSNAPLSAVSALSGVNGLQAVAGYGT